MKRLALFSLAVVLGTAVGAGVHAQESPPNYVLEWGGQGSAPGQFDGPGGIAIHSSGHVYVVDAGNNRVQIFDADGVFVNQWGSYGTGAGQFNRPGGLAIDESDRIYVVDHWNSRVQVFSPDGTFLRIIGSPGGGPGQFNLPWGVEVAFGKVYVADHNNNRIQVFDTEGTFIMSYETPVGSGDGEFHNPADIDVDRDGNIYVTDWNNHRIQKFDSDFNFITKWGHNGNGNGEFTHPHGIEIDHWDRIYVTEAGYDRIQKFDIDGAFLTTWGGRGNGPGQFIDAFDVATSAARVLFVSEGSPDASGNHRIQKFTLPPGGYATDFESFTPGTVDGQDDWWISGAAAAEDGTIVNDGTGNLALQVLAGEDWGDEVGRLFDPTYRRYLVAEMDFQTKDGGGPFWFVDFVPGPSDSIYWWPTSAQSNANPGIGGVSFNQDTWHHIGIEVDQQSREITAVHLNGQWMLDDDSEGISDPAQLNRFYFRGSGAEERLWIDNLSIKGFDTSVILLEDGFECGDCSGWSAMVP